VPPSGHWRFRSQRDAVTRSPLVFVGGPSSETIEPFVQAGGGRVTHDPAAASAVIWLSKESEPLRRILHAGIQWVQLPDAGVERWLSDGLIDDERLFTSAQGCYGPQVAEHALALLLACARGLKGYARSDRWERPHGPAISSLAGSTVVIVGAGDIGARLIALLAPLQARVVAVTRGGRAVSGAAQNLSAEDLDVALPDADFVVLCAPSTPRTRHLIGRHQLAVMKDTAYIVNVGRGDLVDTRALEAAVRDAVIAGAGLDVVDPEPLPSSSPLWDMPTVLITPHVANPAPLKLAALGERVRVNTERFAAGRDLMGVVEIERGY
jgi:phosphoglycerate dehydrogenase-like enzyme